MKTQHKTAVLLLTLAALSLASAVGAAPGVAPVDTVLGAGPGRYELESPDGVVRIPFEMFRNDIRMRAEINGRPVRLFIDNGYLWDDLLFFGSERVDSLGLTRTGQADVGRNAEGPQIASSLAEDVAVTFPGIRFTGQNAVITGYEPGQPNLWEGAEGQVSSAFFKHFVVGMDFDSGIITLTEPDRFEYRGHGTEVPLIPLPRGAWAVPGVIELADGRTISGDLMMDLGDGGALSIVTDGPHGVRPPARSISARLGFGIDGPIMGHFGRVNSVTVGGFTIPQPLAAFVDEESPEDYTEIMIGMEVFRRFNLVFDYPGRRLILEPNLSHAEPMEYDMSGLFLRPTSQGDWTVSRILPDSPGAEAGLAVGDRITAIDGRPAAAYRYWDLQPILRREGAELRLDVQRGDEDVREVAVVLRRLL